MALNGSQEMTQPKFWIGTRVLKGNTMGLIGLSESKQNWITNKPNIT